MVGISVGEVVEVEGVEEVGEGMGKDADSLAREEEDGGRNGSDVYDSDAERAGSRASAWSIEIG